MKGSLLTFTKSTVNECLGRTPIIISILDLPGVMSKARQRQLRGPIPCDIYIIPSPSRWHDGPWQSPSKMFDKVFCLTSTCGICCMIVYYACSTECKWMRPLEFASSMFFGLFWTLATFKGLWESMMCFFVMSHLLVNFPWILSKLGRITQWITHASVFAYRKWLNSYSFTATPFLASVLSRCWCNIGLIIWNRWFLEFSWVQFLVVASSKQGTQHRPTLPFHSEEFHGIGSGTLMG